MASRERRVRLQEQREACEECPGHVRIAMIISIPIPSVGSVAVGKHMANAHFGRPVLGVSAAEARLGAMAGASPTDATELGATRFSSHARSLAANSTCKMVYSWDDKEAECYRLYVEEKRSLDEVVSYWELRGFTPRYVSY